ncbi:MAG TPA: glycosyltransferase [Candidatus Eisenbacteria bacterium]|nr:glycosyltransferase [Candidatus Eisenbacteria bacterium]
MRLLLVYDHHFLRAADGAVYAGHPMAIPGYVAWQPYLRVFEEITVLGRMGRLERGEVPRGAPADGPGVAFHGVPDYLGPWQYVRRYPTVALAVRRAVSEGDAYILKAPGVLGQMARRHIVNRARPYALEVIADPWDLLAPGATPSVMRPMIRRRWTRALHSMCREAAAISYVTCEALQRRYPPGPQTWSTFVSDVDLRSVELAGADLLDERIRRWDSGFSNGTPVRRLRIGFVGALGSLYKGPDVLLGAVADGLKAGLDVELLYVGDGKCRSDLQEMSRRLGVENRVSFLGALLPGRAIQDFLDGLDLFVLPSRQEGLPRAMVEAMARGCPCIGSTVGGIPELLSAEDMVRPQDREGLVAKMREVLLKPERLEAMARRNLTTASEYRPETLDQRRMEFYRKVREQAESARPVMIR